MKNEENPGLKEKSLEAVRDAARQYEAVKERWKRASEEWSADPAHEDGNLAIQLLRRECNAALDRYSDAVKALNPRTPEPRHDSGNAEWDSWRKALRAANVAAWEWTPSTGDMRLSDVVGTDYADTTAPDSNAVIHSDDLQRVAGARANAALSGRFDVTYRMVRPNGEYGCVRSVGSSVPGTEPPRLAGCTIDVTQLVREKQDLAHANEELQEFNLLVSHDLREPLRRIATCLELLKRKGGTRLDTESRKYIGICIDSATHMQALLEDLLTYCRIARPFSVRMRQINSREAFEEARRNLSDAIEQTSAIVEVDDLPSVLFESSALVHVFQNLLSNAIKFRGESPLRVRVSALLDKCYWQFAIVDNGIGIAPEHHEQIFKLLKRLHSRSTYEGTGVGLAICQKIVERHGGRIWVESEPGKGSTFYFTLPAV